MAAATIRRTAQASGQPMPTEAPPAALNDERKERDAARQDADDGKRDGEVREPAHAPMQFLGVAHAVQLLRVLF